MKRSGPTLDSAPAALAQAIRKAFPDGVVEMPADAEEIYFGRIRQRLIRRFSRLKGAELMYQRDCEGQDESLFTEPMQVRLDVDDLEEPPPPDRGSASFHLFFIGLTCEKFTYICEGEKFESGPDEPSEPPNDGDLSQAFLGLQEGEGKGWIGCCVAVSLLAPLAIVELGIFEVYGPTEYTLPDIEPSVFGMDGRPLEMEQHFRETMGPDAVGVLREVRKQIEAILRACGVEVLSKGVFRKKVPGLRAGDEAFVGLPGAKSITVKGAFFFLGP